MDTDDKRALVRLDRSFNEIRKTASMTIPLQVAQTFLAVAIKEGQSVTEIKEGADSNLSTVSRHLLDLGARPKEQGGINYGLIESRSVPEDLRRKEFWLTAKGKLLRKSLVDIQGA